jgi:hypothetical protein
MSKLESTLQKAVTDDFETYVLKAEGAAVRQRRQRYGLPDNLDDMFGVALSGGGIRSGSFSLGVLQALDAYGLTHRIDYLSTVSGGGYIGAGMVKAMSENKGEFPFATQIPNEYSDSLDVMHLRNYSRFLIPNGLADVFLSLGVILRGLATNIVTVLAFLFFFASVTLATNPARDHLAHSFFYDMLCAAQLLDTKQMDGWLFSKAISSLSAWLGSHSPTWLFPAILSWSASRFALTKLLLLIGAMLLIFWAFLKSRPTRGKLPRDIDSGMAFLVKRFLILFMIVFSLEMNTLAVEKLIELYAETTWDFASASKYYALLAGYAATAAAFREKLVSFIANGLGMNTRAGAFTAYGAAVLLFVAGLVVPVLIYLFYVLVVYRGIGLPTGTSGFASCCHLITSFRISDLSQYVFQVYRGIVLLTGTSGVPDCCAFISSFRISDLAPYIFHVCSGIGLLTGTSGATDCCALVSPFRISELVQYIFRVYHDIWLSIGVIGVADCCDSISPFGISDISQYIFHERPMVFSGIALVLLVVLAFYYAVVLLGEQVNGEDMRSGVFPLLLILLSILNFTDGSYVTYFSDSSRLYFELSIILMALMLNFSANSNSLHGLYRDRLRKAFLTRPAAEQKRTFFHDLQCQHAPYLLMNCSLNARVISKRYKGQKSFKDIEQRAIFTDPARRGRHAEFFFFSPKTFGSTATGFLKSEKLQAGEYNIDLASAMAISGAAASSSMGKGSFGILTATLALLNIRLGYWLRNPLWDDDATINVGKVKVALLDRIGFYFFAEIFGQLRTDSPKIYLTDGGHSENLGLYQLVKRRCPFIIVADAEADPQYTFAALADLQRYARIDLGVRIEVDWKHIRNLALDGEKNGLQSPTSNVDPKFGHFAVGKIFYPREAGKPAFEGTLLYLKSAVTGDEPDYVLDYKRRYPAFPQEATADQFFLEDQMEAYRALGFHTVQIAFCETDVREVGMVPGQLAIWDMKTRLGISGKELG